MTIATHFPAIRGTDRVESGLQAAGYGNGLREVGVAVAAAIGLCAPMLAIGGWLLYSGQAERDSFRSDYEARLVAHDRLLAEPARAMLPVETAVHGRSLFESTCATCHKADGTGVEGLGKDLTRSWFIASLDDAGLRAFINEGRPATDRLNTTKVPMPPKGGQEQLTDADLNDIIVYVRGLQDPRRMPPLPASVPAAVAVATGPATEAEKAKALAAAGGDEELAGYIVHGSRVFAATCAACHGKEGKGLPNLGKDMTHSEFIKKLDDDGLLKFIQRGRDPGDPLNTTKVGMPPKGGNPALSEDDLLDVIAFIRALQKQAGTVP